ncbi:MAG: hypothetical protein KGH93_02185 [Patescibacteria group bacterium]|nr:hypothetical protein [Patescibacteria group bacterium]MDE1945986.1 hypothetical protein [Patescibacteria group bacterium]
MKEKKEVSKPFVIVLLITIVFLAVFCVREYRRISRLDLINAYKERFAQEVGEHRGPLGAKDAVLVASWMTFGYVNMIFKLPPEYLQNDLAISDGGYPNVSIGHYAKTHALDQKLFVVAAQKAVAAYFATTTAQ